MQLDPNFAIAWARLSRADAFSTLTATTLLPPLGATQRNVLWRMRRNWSRTRLRPCSPWVIINTGCCVITGLPKPRSSASAKCYQAAARSHRPSAELPDARDTGIKALPTSSKPSPWTHVMWSYLCDAAETYAVLRQFPAALKLYDRVLDITPNDPDVMAAKASIYQAQGNLQEAARFLSGINEQTPSEDTFEIKITQLRLERNYGEAIRLLQARLAQFHFDSEDDKAVIRWSLLSCSALLAIRLGQRLPLNRRAIHSSSSTEINQTTPALWRQAVSSLCRDGGEGLGPKGSGACNHASAPC